MAKDVDKALAALIEALIPVCGFFPAGPLPQAQKDMAAERFGVDGVAERLGPVVIAIEGLVDAKVREHTRDHDCHEGSDR